MTISVAQAVQASNGSSGQTSLAAPVFCTVTIVTARMARVWHIAHNLMTPFQMTV